MANMVDYINRAFFAKDKATRDAIVADAQAELEKEPDGDEGEGSKTVNVHVHGGSSDSSNALNGRVEKLEDGLRALDSKISKVLDAVSKRTKDEDGDDGKDKDKEDEDKKTDDAEGDKDEDDDDKKDDTKDEELDMGENAQTGSPPPSAEPDLMEADPSLKTGPSMMGDATYKVRVNQAMQHLVRDTKARAEILSPGIKVGVLDGAAGADRMKQAGGRICDIRRQALVSAAGNERGMVAVGRHTKDAITTMSCDAVRMLFIDASNRMREMNNAASMPSPQFGEYRRTVNNDLRSRIEDINKRNAEFWKTQGGTARRVV